MITNIALLLLFSAALWAALRQYKLWQRSELSAFAFLALALSLIAASALSSLAFRHSSSLDLSTFDRILENLMHFIAVPVIATAMLSFRFNCHVSRPAWGRWVLALCALFELLRRSELGDDYAVVLPVIAVIAMAIASIGPSQQRLSSLYTISCVTIALATLAEQFNFWVLKNSLDPDMVTALSASSMAVACIALRSAHNVPDIKKAAL